MSRLYVFLIIAAALTAGSGCATISAISTAERGSPKVYAGTRLDLHAIAGNESALRRFRTEPPRYPWLDLPFSALLDTLMVPLTLSVAAYESLE